MDKHDNKQRQGLDGFGGGSDRYICFLLVVSHLPSQRELNRLIDLGKVSKSLNNLVYISNIG